MPSISSSLMALSLFCPHFIWPHPPVMFHLLLCPNLISSHPLLMFHTLLCPHFISSHPILSSRLFLFHALISSPPLIAHPPVLAHLHSAFLSLEEGKKVCLFPQSTPPSPFLFVYSRFFPSLSPSLLSLGFFPQHFFVCLSICLCMIMMFWPGCTAFFVRS